MIAALRFGWASAVYDAPVRVAAVVLNWNGADDTIECLRSLREQTLQPHVIVVDNGSTDESVARIQQSGFADEIIALRRNGGYAGGNNVGVLAALNSGAEIVGVLNNDTVTDREMVRLLSEAVTARRAVSADVRYFDDRERSWFAGARVDHGIPVHLDLFQRRRTPVLSGCCIFAHADTWRRCGLFDEGFVLLYEDYDWSFRAARRGVELEVAPEAIMFHKAGRSFARRDTPTAEVFLSARNRLRMVWRWQRRHVVATIFAIIVEVLRRVKHGQLRLAWATTAGMAAFFLDHRGWPPALAQARRPYTSNL